MANDGTDLHYLSATALADLVRERKVGCLELLDHFLDRVRRHNPTLNAIIVLLADEARERAREADAALARGDVWGPLHGVPMTIKESFDVAGTPSTWGVPELRDNIATGRLAGGQAAEAGRRHPVRKDQRAADAVGLAELQRDLRDDRQSLEHGALPRRILGRGPRQHSRPA